LNFNSWILTFSSWPSSNWFSKTLSCRSSDFNVFAFKPIVCLPGKLQHSYNFLHSVFFNNSSTFGMLYSLSPSWLFQFHGFILTRLSVLKSWRGRHFVVIIIFTLLQQYPNCTKAKKTWPSLSHSLWFTSLRGSFHSPPETGTPAIYSCPGLWPHES
jgi:hypothetical protein